MTDLPIILTNAPEASRRLSRSNPKPPTSTSAVQVDIHDDFKVEDIVERYDLIRRRVQTLRAAIAELRQRAARSTGSSDGGSTAS